MFFRKLFEKLFPKFPKFLRLFSKIIIGVSSIASLLGYYPTTGFPPIKKFFVSANEPLTQDHIIIAQTLPFKVQQLFPGYISQNFNSWHKALQKS